MAQTTALKDALDFSTQESSTAQQDNWFLKGSCTDLDPEEFFAETVSGQKQARTLCFDCPVRLECLADALDNHVEFGVWGGMTERERRALLRQSPNVQSWFPILRQIQDEQEERRRTARAGLVELWRNKMARENSSLESR